MMGGGGGQLPASAMHIVRKALDSPRERSTEAPWGEEILLHPRPVCLLPEERVVAWCLATRAMSLLYFPLVASL
jgi:hypothetical protein